MVNTQLFQSQRGAMLPAALDTNNELAPAYAFSPRHQLAQLAATGCLRQTFYAQAQDQLDRVMTLAAEVDPAFVARTAVYARESGHMKTCRPCWPRSWRCATWSCWRRCFRA